MPTRCADPQVGGCRQYRAEAGKRLIVEKLDKKLGEQFDLDQVLFVGGEKAALGNPTVKGAKVTVVVTQQKRGPKILIFKKKRRHGLRRMNGHRQPFTELFVVSITNAGETVKADSKAIVIDPAKKAERMAKFAGLSKTEKKEMAAKKAASKVAKKSATATAKKKTSKKPAKKTAAKKTKKK